MPKKTAAATSASAPKEVKQIASSKALRELAPVQQFICDEIADLLVNGGHEKSVNFMISAACHHAWWRWIVNLHGAGESAQHEEWMAKTASRDFAEHKAELRAVWKQNRRTEPAKQAEPKTAGDRIRACILDRLRDHLEGFAVRATPAECLVMNEIMVTHESTTHGRMDFDELPIAGAFESVLSGEAPTYVRVPEHLQKKVQSYIEALRAANIKDDPYRPAA